MTEMNHLLAVVRVEIDDETDLPATQEELIEATSDVEDVRCVTTNRVPMSGHDNVPMAVSASDLPERALVGVQGTDRSRAERLQAVKAELDALRDEVDSSENRELSDTLDSARFSVDQALDLEVDDYDLESQHNLVSQHNLGFSVSTRSSPLTCSKLLDGEKPVRQQQYSGSIYIGGFDPELLGIDLEFLSANSGENAEENDDE